MKLLAIDGNSILNRAFFGIRLLTNRDGVYTNAVFGFLNILQKLEREIAPDETTVAFDVSRHTFRSDLYDQYKANRKGMPAELAQQLPLVKEILTDMGYVLAAKEGYEGDDVLGTLAKCACGQGSTCVVATGDRDCLQLVNDCVTVCLVKTKENILYTTDKVMEDYHITPAQVIEMKALMGDTSDNIPGVRGIGEKTALSLIQKCGSIDQIYQDVDAIEATPRVKQLLKDGRETAFLSRKLATICLDAPIDTDLETYKRTAGDVEALRALLKKLELYTFVSKLAPGEDTPAVPEETCSPAVFGDDKAASAVRAIQNDQKVYLLYTDTGMQLQIEGTIYPIEKADEEKIYQALDETQAPVFTDRAKTLYKAARARKLTLSVKFDASLAGYLLSVGAKSYDLAELRDRYLPEKDAGCQKEYQEMALFPALCDRLEALLEEKGEKKLLDEIEMPLCGVLADMEEDGFAVDREGVERFGRQLDHDISLTKEQIIRLAGEEFNVNSTRELGHILFEKLGLPAKKKTKTGYSTNIEVLEELAEQHEIVPQIIEYRKLNKLYSTYVIGLLKVLKSDGRVHSTFNQTETRTGRISSAEPNVQNIPVRTELGSEMRRFFVAAPGNVLVDADYSQIELRILAHIADDPTMIDAFLHNADIHAITASQVFGYPLDNLPHELRSRAKAINFGIVYGIGAFSLAKNIHVPIYEARQYIETYLKTYSGVAAYQKKVVEDAKENGFVTTLYGRRRELPDIHSSNKNVRAFAERVAMNTPIQGTAADIIKLAMVRVHERLLREKLPAKLILQVHDELIVETQKEAVETVKALLKEEMEHAAQLKVPLTADVSAGENWYTAKQ